MRRAAAVALMLVALTSVAWGQEPDKPLPVSTKPDPARLPLVPTGAMSVTVVDLTPGDMAPDFQLDSSLGGTVRLADLKGHWSVLVFHESRMKLAPLGVAGDSIQAMGVRPFGVCRDGIGALRSFAEREKIAFPLLSDPTGEISQLFGMYDEHHQAIQSGIVIVDAQGMVRMVVQGPLLHADDVLLMLRHVIRGA